jgi:hypothetical protein
MPPVMTETHEPTPAEMDKMNELGENLFDEVTERAGEISEDESSDQIGILFHVWFSLTRLLLEAGWKKKELAKEVKILASDVDFPVEGSA